MLPSCHEIGRAAYHIMCGKIYFLKGMINMLATVPSVTAAVKLKKLLKYKGINADIVQPPAAIREKGCMYALKFNKDYKNKVLNIAKSSDVEIKKIWDETIGGSNEDNISR